MTLTPAPSSSEPLVPLGKLPTPDEVDAAKRRFEEELPKFPDVMIVKIQRNMFGIEQALDSMGIKLRYNLNGGVLEFLQNPADWSKRLRVMQGVIWKVPSGSPTVWERWDKAVEARVLALMKVAYEHASHPFTMPKDKFRDDLLALAQINSVNPFMDWIEAMPEWDGVERVECQLNDLFNAGHGELAKWASRYPFVGALQRSYAAKFKKYNDLKIDCMPILVGGQWLGKSCWARNIVPEHEQHSWFMDNFHLDTPAKERKELLGGRIIVEVSELNARKDLEKMKAMLTSIIDSGRDAYASTRTDQVRLCVFIGTSNTTGKGILTYDASGNRRFAVIECKSAVKDTGGRARANERVEDYMEERREQFWAEALHKYREGEWTTADLPYGLADARDKANEDYLDADESIENSLVQYIEAHPGKLAIVDVCKTLFPDKSSTLKEQYTIAEILTNNGFTKRRITTKETGGKKITYWFPPDTEPF